MDPDKKVLIAKQGSGILKMSPSFFLFFFLQIFKSIFLANDWMTGLIVKPILFPRVMGEGLFVPIWEILEATWLSWINSSRRIVWHKKWENGFCPCLCSKEIAWAPLSPAFPEYLKTAFHLPSRNIKKRKLGRFSWSDENSGEFPEFLALLH